MPLERTGAGLGAHGCRDSSGVLAPRERGQSTGRGFFAISCGGRLKVSTSISATNTAPTATVATAAPPTMRAATMPTTFTGSDTRSRLALFRYGLATVLQAQRARSLLLRSTLPV